MPPIPLAPLPLLLANVGAWVAIQVGMGYLIAQVAPARFHPDAWLFRSREWESEGRIYRRLLRVRRWKRRLPSGGLVFGDFSLGRLESTEKEYLGRWLTESCRAELSHWLALAPVGLFWLWNPPLGGAINVVYALAVNLPCIVAQRYNRPRVRALQERHRRAEIIPEPA